MSTLYWITVLGNIGVICAVFAVLLLIALFFCAIFMIDTPSYRPIFKRILCAFIPLAFLGIFIPNKQELYIIYGVGTTLDYIKDNPTSKQLPDKCIKAIETYLGKLSDEDK
jgi:hypothetical protein